MSIYENLFNMYMEQLSEHELQVIQDGKVQVYRIGKPGTRCMSTLLVFTHEGIILQGDFTPEQNGSVSSIGYSLAWFLGELSPDYLCEKFLRREFVPDYAREELLDPNGYWREDQPQDILDKLDEIAKEIDCNGSDWLYNELMDLDFCLDGGIGYDYAPQKKAALCVIQQKFKELIEKKNKQELVDGITAKLNDKVKDNLLFEDTPENRLAEEKSLLNILPGGSEVRWNSDGEAIATIKFPLTEEEANELREKGSVKLEGFVSQGD